MSKIKVLLIQNYIAHYNLPIFNLLGDQSAIDLTIAHFGIRKLESGKSFDEQLLICKKIGPIFLVKGDLHSFCNNFNVVIAMGDMHFVSLMMLGRNPKRLFKLIFWGIGVSASYKNRLDENRKWDFLRFYFMRSADALLFYSNYPVNKYLKNGFLREQLFVADNTVEVKRTMLSDNPKNSILFIGTLYKEKGIYELLIAYREAYLISSDLPKFNIIGGGSEFNNIAAWINDNNLNNHILMNGVIYNDTILERFFMDAIVTISPSQAGLSVLKSMGYGVPFITRFDSITGGERFNIINNKTGLIYNSSQELINIICSLKKEKEKYIRMGDNARRFYEKYRLPKHMVQGFLDAITYVYSK